MRKTKKLQIPISSEDEKMIKAIAKIYHVSAAEWVRNTIIRAAQRDLFQNSLEDSSGLIKKLAGLNAPSGKVKVMKEESLKGRYS